MTELPDSFANGGLRPLAENYDYLLSWLADNDVDETPVPGHMTYRQHVITIYGESRGVT